MGRRTPKKTARRKARKSTKNNKKVGTLSVYTGEGRPDVHYVGVDEDEAAEIEGMIENMVIFDHNPDHDDLKVSEDVIAYYEERQGRKIVDITPLLPEATVPIAIEEGLLAALESTGDYDNHVWDVFNMSVNAPYKFQIDYNTFFKMGLLAGPNEGEIVVAATQFGHEPCMVFALAEDSCQWVEYKNHPEVKALF